MTACKDNFVPGYLGIMITRQVQFCCIFAATKDKFDYFLKKLHYEKKLTKNIRSTNILQIYINALKFTKYLINVHKFTKYLVNSYHQRGVKHYVLTN